MKFPITGITGETKTIGSLTHCGCPNCYQRVSMVLVETSLRPRFYHIPTIKLRKKVVATCANCFSRFIPSKKALSQGKSSPTRLIWPEEFKEYKQT